MPGPVNKESVIGRAVQGGREKNEELLGGFASDVINHAICATIVLNVEQEL